MFACLICCNNALQPNQVIVIELKVQILCISVTLSQTIWNGVFSLDVLVPILKCRLPASLCSPSLAVLTGAPGSPAAPRAPGSPESP